MQMISHLSDLTSTSNQEQAKMNIKYKTFKLFKKAEAHLNITSVFLCQDAVNKLCVVNEHTHTHTRGVMWTCSKWLKLTLSLTTAVTLAEDMMAFSKKKKLNQILNYLVCLSFTAGERATRKPSTSQPFHWRFLVRDQVWWGFSTSDFQHSWYCIVTFSLNSSHTVNQVCGLCFYLGSHVMQ